MSDVIRRCNAVMASRTRTAMRNMPQRLHYAKRFVIYCRIYHLLMLLHSPGHTAFAFVPRRGYAAVCGVITIARALITRRPLCTRRCTRRPRHMRRQPQAINDFVLGPYRTSCGMHWPDFTKGLRSGHHD